mmetsp:Transcript_65561/g.182254  ORF Transcript_65561/g.182254 Transcript_65561/m.182254 type:complete len:243 (-) Transcript_65561:20-748(-)
MVITTTSFASMDLLPPSTRSNLGNLWGTFALRSKGCSVRAAVQTSTIPDVGSTQHIRTATGNAFNDFAARCWKDKRKISTPCVDTTTRSAWSVCRDIAGNQKKLRTSKTSRPPPHLNAKLMGSLDGCRVSAQPMMLLSQRNAKYIPSGEKRTNLRPSGSNLTKSPSGVSPSSTMSIAKKLPRCRWMTRWCSSSNDTCSSFAELSQSYSGSDKCSGLRIMTCFRGDHSRPTLEGNPSRSARQS